MGEWGGVGVEEGCICFLFVFAKEEWMTGIMLNQIA